MVTSLRALVRGYLRRLNPPAPSADIHLELVRALYGPTGTSKAMLGAAAAGLIAMAASWWLSSDPVFGYLFAGYLIVGALRSLGVLLYHHTARADESADTLKKIGVQPVMVSVQDPAKAADELARVMPESIKTMRGTDPDLSNSVFLITGSTSVFKEIATINKHAGRIPVISMIPEIVQAGPDTALLAVGISFESNAQLAAIYGADILNGRAKPGDLKVGLVLPPDIAVSFMKARQIGVKIPFHFFEGASYVYDVNGQPVRAPVQTVAAKE